MEDTGWCGGETRDRELRYMNLFCIRKRAESALLRVVAQRFGTVAFSMNLSRRLFALKVEIRHFFTGRMHR